MGEEVLVNRIREKELLLDRKDKDLNPRTVADFKASVLEMVVSRCHLE